MCSFVHATTRKDSARPRTVSPPMARRYSLHLLVRIIPSRLFGRVLSRLHIRLNLPAGRRRTDVDAAVEAIRGLARARFDELEAALRSIHELAERGGPAVLIEADNLAGKGDLARHFKADACPHEWATWTWVNRRTVFKRAVAFGRMDQIRTWRRRDDLPRRLPDVGRTARARLAREITEVLLAEQARGRRCTVSGLSRDSVTYVFAYPDDYARTVQSHDGAGRLVKRTHRATFDVVFAYDERTGMLETAADVPPRVKDKLDAAFADACLGHVLGPCPKGAVYHLDLLADRDFKFVSEPEDGLTMTLRKVNLEFPDSERAIDLTNHRGKDEDMRPLFDCLDQNRVVLDAMRVKSARLEAKFDGYGEAAAGSVTFYLSQNACNLRDQPEARVAAVRRCLEASGLVRTGVRS
jgi:hypothetical protein